MEQMRLSGTGMLLALLMLAAGGMPPAVAAGGPRHAIAIEQAWARASMGTSHPAAAYLTVTNKSDRAVRLVAASSPVAGHVEIHRTEMQGGIMKMTPVGALVIPPGEEIAFAPGGLHVMLKDLKHPLAKGNTIPLTLEFEPGGPITVTVPVLGMGAKGPNH